MVEVVKVPGIVLQLAGKAYTVPPLSLGAMEQLQAALATFDGDVSKPGQVGTAIDATHAALRRNYPDLTREDVGGMIGLDNMISVMEAVMDVSGMRRKAAEAEATEGQLLGEAP